MLISLTIEELQRHKETHGDLPAEVKVQFTASHVCGGIIDIKYRSTGIGKPFVQIVAQEK